jgi:hypothetical protein
MEEEKDKKARKEIVNSFREMVELRKERLEIKKSVGVTPTW